MSAGRRNRASHRDPRVPLDSADLPPVIWRRPSARAWECRGGEIRRSPIDGNPQGLGCRPGGRRRELHGRAGPFGRAARAFRMRKVDDAADHRRARNSGFRHGDHRGPRRHLAAAVAARGGHGVPILRAVSAPHRRREHPVRAEGAQGAAGRAGRAVGPRGRHSRARQAAPAQAGAAFRRPAAARRARAHDRQRDAGLFDGRAAVQPRRAVARRHAPGDPGAAAPAGHHHGLCHPRPG